MEERQRTNIYILTDDYGLVRVTWTSKIPLSRAVFSIMYSRQRTLAIDSACLYFLGCLADK